MSAYAAQTRVELTLTARRASRCCSPSRIPVLLLLFFSVVDVLPTGTDDPIDFLRPASWPSP